MVACPIRLFLELKAEFVGVFAILFANLLVSALLNVELILQVVYFLLEPDVLLKKLLLLFVDVEVKCFVDFELLWEMVGLHFSCPVSQAISLHRQRSIHILNEVEFWMIFMRVT